MTRKQGAIYEVTVPAAEVKEGVFRYNIVAFNKGKRQTFPGGNGGYTARLGLHWGPILGNPCCQSISRNIVGCSFCFFFRERCGTVHRSTGRCFVSYGSTSAMRWQDVKASCNKCSTLRAIKERSTEGSRFITSDGFTYKAKGNTSQEGIPGYLCRPCSKRPPHCFPALILFFWINSLSLLRIFRSKCRRLNRWRFLISPRIWCSKSMDRITNNQ